MELATERTQDRQGSMRWSCTLKIAEGQWEASPRSKGQDPKEAQAQWGCEDALVNGGTEGEVRARGAKVSPTGDTPTGAAPWPALNHSVQELSFLEGMGLDGMGVCTIWWERNGMKFTGQGMSEPLYQQWGYWEEEFAFLSPPPPLPAAFSLSHFFYACSWRQLMQSLWSLQADDEFKAASPCVCNLPWICTSK